MDVLRVYFSLVIRAESAGLELDAADLRALMAYAHQIAARYARRFGCAVRLGKVTRPAPERAPFGRRAAAYQRGWQDACSGVVDAGAGADADYADGRADGEWDAA